MLDLSLLPFVSERATLRLMSSADAPLYTAGTADPELRSWPPLPESEHPSAPQAPSNAEADEQRMGRDDLTVLAIAHPQTDEFIGSLMLFNVAHDSAEICWWLASRYRGSGRAEAALALASELARRSGLVALRAQASAANVVAHRVLEKVGYLDQGWEPRRTGTREQVELRRYELAVPTDLTPTLRTERLRLRGYERRDRDALQQMYGDPESARYLLDEPWSDSFAELQINQRLPRTSLTRAPHSLGWVVEHEGAVVGEVLLWLTDVAGKVAEIGWVLDPSASGKGFATEAVTAVLQLAFEDYELHRVVAQLDPRNEASARLAQRVGLRQEAHLRQNWWSKGEWTDTLIFAALHSDPGFMPEQR